MLINKAKMKMYIYLYSFLLVYHIPAIYIGGGRLRFVSKLVLSIDRYIFFILSPFIDKTADFCVPTSCGLQILINT